MGAAQPGMQITKIVFISRQLQRFSFPILRSSAIFIFPLFRFVVISDCLLWFMVQSKFKYILNCQGSLCGA